MVQDNGYRSANKSWHVIMATERNDPWQVTMAKERQKESWHMTVVRERKAGEPWHITMARQENMACDDNNGKT